MSRDFLGLHSKPITCVAVGHYTAVMSGDSGGVVKIWKQDSADVQTTLFASDEPMSSVCFTTSDSVAVTGCEGGVVKVWNLQQLSF